MKLLTILRCDAEAKLTLSFLAPFPLLIGLEHRNQNNKKPNCVLQCAAAEEPFQDIIVLA